MILTSVQFQKEKWEERKTFKLEKENIQIRQRKVFQLEKRNIFQLEKEKYSNKKKEIDSN